MAVFVPNVSDENDIKNKEMRNFKEEEKERLNRNNFSLMIKKFPSSFCLKSRQVLI